MSMPRAVKHINESRLIGSLLRDGAQSRADLARRLDMTRSTAGNLIGGLAERGLVVAVASDATPRDVGRPGRDFALNGDHVHFLGVEIGVGYLRARLMDLAGQVIFDGTRAFDLTADPATVVAHLANMTRELLAARATPAPVHGLCVSVPGVVTPNGQLVRAPYLGWRDVPLRTLLHEALPDMPLILTENDANAFAQSQVTALRAQGVQNALFFWIEAGVGGAALCNGALLRGRNGFAGEFGHLPTVAEDLECHVGTDAAPTTPDVARIEQVVGLVGLLPGISKTPDAAAAVARFLVEADKGDPAAQSRLNRWTRVFARTIVSLSSAFDPSHVIVGGPGAQILTHRRDALISQCKAIQIPDSPMPTLLAVENGEGAAALGCATLLHADYLAIDKTLVFGETGVDP